MAVFNKYSIHDDIHNLFTLGATTELGRWGLDILQHLSGIFFGKFGGSQVYSISIVQFFYIVVFLSISLYLMVKLLGIKSLLSCVVLSGVFITSFFFTALFCYMFTSAAYMFGFLLSVFGVYLICNYKTRKIFWCGIVSMIFSLSIYQAFFAVSLSLIIMFFIKETINKKNITFKDFIKDSLYYIGFCVIVVVLYFVLVKLFLSFRHSQLSSYQNVNNMGKLGIVTYLKSIFATYFYFWNPIEFFRFYTIYVYRIIVTVLFVLIFYKSKELYKIDRNKFYLFVFLNVIFPLSSNIVYVMVGNSGFIHILMLVGQLMLFPYLLFLFENVTEKNTEKAKNIGYISLFLMIFMFIRWDNVFYLKLQFVETRTKSYFTSLIAQIKNTSGYADEYPVVFINETNKKDENIRNLPFPEFSLDFLVNLINDYSWRSFMYNWLAYEPKYEHPEKFENLPEVKSMPHYPDYGSIKIINKTVVVKF